MIDKFWVDGIVPLSTGIYIYRQTGSVVVVGQVAILDAVVLVCLPDARRTALAWHQNRQASAVTSALVIQYGAINVLCGSVDFALACWVEAIGLRQCNQSAQVPIIQGT